VPALLAKQKKKMNGDLEAVREYHHKRVEMLSPDENTFSDIYRYAWMLVNSRSFYWDYPAAQPERKQSRGKQKPKSLPVNDCMTLCPFMDYFNHSNGGVSTCKA